MSLIEHADRRPEHPAVVMAGIKAVRSFGELDQRSTKLARHLRAEGLRPGDGIAPMMRTEVEFFDALWGRCARGSW